MSDIGRDAAPLASALGRVGVWLFGAAFDADPAGVASRLEHLGYGALWVGGGNTKPSAFARIGAALAGSSSLVLATGITSIWAWEPAELARQARSIELGHPGRFLLGLGVSHAPLVEHLGLRYERPYSAMERFLGDLATATAAEHGPPVPLVLAALGDKMLALSGQESAGAHPYFVPVEHTRHARAVLGPDPLLAPELAVVAETDPSAARAVARQYMERYLSLPNYAGNLSRLGYSDEDLAGGGSDRLVDAIVAWGSPSDIAARVRAHLDAGADHVCIQPLAAGGAVDYAALETLAPLLVAAR
ncbi:MAG: TIGR03620 family F420-dependent LLM class oxidoreductase [Actinomycetota bacterium]|nr:TIGR03620 family F420-dependent LLM class oxidoreductase [Actinomycetota bacterium]